MKSTTNYKPTLHDVNWIKNLVASLKIGGVWSYTSEPITFKKIGWRTMALIAAPKYGCDEQIKRNKVVMKAAGIRYEDRR